MQKKILISGSSSGLGKYLLNKFKAVKFNRNLYQKEIINTRWDLIIHCAYNSKTFNIINAEKYMNDNIANSLYISGLKGKKVFMSTTQVYESNKLRSRKETDYIDPKKLSLYPLSKFVCEKFFEKKDIILRLGSIIGEGMRENTIYNLLHTKLPKLNLNQNSKFSFVTYQEIYETIQLLVNNKKEGVFNVLRNDFISLKQVSKKFNISNVKYGKYSFHGTKADNKKISKIKNLNNKTSLELLKFLK